MRKNLNTLFVSALLMCSVSAQGQTYEYLISTVAGNGTGGFGPDNGQATASKLYSPWAVAVDKSGNLYIADKSNNRVRKVSTSGIITTVAGNGTAGYMGDGTAATAAELSLPQGVAVDAGGNIYIADYTNNVVRKVNSAGIISTFAGPGVAATLGDGGAATAAYLSEPASVAVDKYGNVFIADENNQRIRKVDGSGMISTYAGTGVGGYNMDGVAATLSQINIPSAICVDTFGNLYIADESNYRVRKVTASTGIITTVAGIGLSGFTGNGGPATSAKISYTYGVAVDDTGNIFLSDVDVVREVRAATGNISVYAGSFGITGFTGDGGLADTSKLFDPQELATDAAGNLYIADEQNNRVRKVYKKAVVSAVQQISGQNNNLNVFPNPNNGTFTIKGSLNSINDENVTVSVMDLSGQVIYKNDVEVHNGDLNTSVTLARNLPDGYYLLNIRSGTQNDIARFIIQK